VTLALDIRLITSWKQFAPRISHKCTDLWSEQIQARTTNQSPVQLTIWVALVLLDGMQQFLRLSQ
jgi:hypothetical protein